MFTYCFNNEFISISFISLLCILNFYDDERCKMNFPVRDNKVLLYCIVLYCIVCHVLCCCQLHYTAVCHVLCCYQLHYTDEGLRVSLRRDVRNARMSSGALQADADVETGGKYSVSAAETIVEEGCLR